MTEYVLPIVVIIVLVILNGLFVAAEFALVGSRLSRLEKLATDGSKAAGWLVDTFKRHAGKDSYIAVAQLGITLASIGLGMYGEPAVAHWLYEPLEQFGVPKTASHTVGFLIALSAITFMHVVFGEMIPKALALQAPEPVSVRLNPLMRAFSALFRPMVAVLNAIAFALMRLLRIPEPDKSMSLYTSAELAIVTDEAAHSGQLGDMQRDLIRNIFELDERPAEEMMMHRSNIVALDISAKPDEVAEFIKTTRRSRYPVVDGDLDHVVGMFHIKDYIRASASGSFTGLSNMVRPLPVVAATTTAEDLLVQFKQATTHAALVVDEFGATVGFVSLDDVIEEIMEDEVDLIVAHADGSVSVAGETPLSDLRVALNEPVFDHEDIVTIAGLVLAHAGEVPAIGDTVVHDRYTLTVEEATGRRISKVRITETGGTEASGADGHSEAH